jgi:predicted metal-dependent hydrolase
MRILVDGELVRLDVRLDAGKVLVTAGDQEVARGAALDAANVRPIVERWLRARAARELGPALLGLAAAHGIDVPRVSVRNQQSRWGACSRTGSITLNWRLVQAPPFVRTYVMLHELMHRRELNHSRRFWRLVAAVCPRYQEARRWLLTEGRNLF